MENLEDLKIPKRLRKPLVTKTLIIKVPRGVDPNGVAVDVPAAMAAAQNPQPGDDDDFDVRLLVHLVDRQFSKLNPKALGDTAQYIRQMRNGLNPRDKIEELLAGSILMTYGRLAHLTHRASRCKNEFDMMQLYAAAETNANSLRKQLMCLANYRERTITATLTSENIENLTNELKMAHEKTTLPSDGSGLGSKTHNHAGEAALETLDRPQDHEGKEDVFAQRL